MPRGQRTNELDPLLCEFHSEDNAAEVCACVVLKTTVACCDAQTKPSTRP